MKKYLNIVILAILIPSISCQIDNVGPLLDDLDVIFFTSDGIDVLESSNEPILVEIGSTQGGNSTELTLGGTAVRNVDYTISDDLNITFSEGVYTASVSISLIDNQNPNDDHTITLSLPEGQGYSDSSRRVFVVNIINNEVPSGTVVSTISSTNDDAEEGINGEEPGNMYDMDSSDLEFGEAEGGTNGVQKIGLRFTAINIPNGATINSASIQFTVDEDVDNPATVVMNIYGENVDDASTFESVDLDISDRPLTTASAIWDIPVWTTAGEASSDQKTVDLKAIIQEIVQREGWQTGNSLGIIFVPTAATLANPEESGRVAEAYDGDPDAAPVITIDWEI